MTASRPGPHFGELQRWPFTRNATGGAIVVGRFLGTVVVTLHGNVDLINAAALADALHELIDAHRDLAVVVDLRDAGWVDGAGVGVLASAASRIETGGGELRLAGPRTAVAEALALSGLARLLSIPFEQPHRPWPPAWLGRPGVTWSWHRCSSRRQPLSKREGRDSMSRCKPNGCGGEDSVLDVRNLR